MADKATAALTEVYTLLRRAGAVRNRLAENGDLSDRETKQLDWVHVLARMEYKLLKRMLRRRGVSTGDLKRIRRLAGRPRP